MSPCGVRTAETPSGYPGFQERRHLTPWSFTADMKSFTVGFTCACEGKTIWKKRGDVSNVAVRTGIVLYLCENMSLSELVVDLDNYSVIDLFPLYMIQTWWTHEK